MTSWILPSSREWQSRSATVNIRPLRLHSQTLGPHPGQTNIGNATYRSESHNHNALL